MGFGIIEILIIVGIIVLVVGGKRLPEMGSGLAKAIKGFKRTMQESDHINVTPEQRQQDEKSKGPSANQKDTSRT